MNIFDRYIARQILISTALAVVMLSVVLVLGQIFKKLLDALVAGILPPSAVFKFMGYAFPMSLSYTVPWGLLTAVLLTFGRLSADNELVSMRMAGMSLKRICLPVFIVAGALSGLCFWINTTVAPFAYNETARMTRQAVIRDPRILFQPDKTVDQLPGHLMYTGDRKGDALKNMQIIELQGEGDKGKRGRPSLMIFAKEGRITTEGMEQRHAIEFGAMDNTFFVRDEMPPLSPGDRSKMTPEAIAKYEAVIAAQSKGPPAVFDLGTALSEIPIGMKALFDKSAAVRVEGLTMREIQSALKAPGSLQLANPGVKVPAPTEMRTEWHRRISFSLACFILALAGISFGITAQRRETSSGFVLSLVVGIGYFSLIMLSGIWSSKPNYHPHLWVWLPNVIFGFLGIVMFRRLARR